MPIPSNITDLSTTPASNSPAGSENPIEGDNHIRTVYSFIRQLYDGITASGYPTLAGLADTASAAKGDALIGVKATATGSVATTQHEVNERGRLSCFTFMTSAQKADVIARTLAVDVATPLQTWIDYCASACIAGEWEAGSYSISTSLIIPNRTDLLGQGMGDGASFGQTSIYPVNNTFAAFVNKPADAAAMRNVKLRQFRVVGGLQNICLTTTGTISGCLFDELWLTAPAQDNFLVDEMFISNVLRNVVFDATPTSYTGFKVAAANTNNVLFDNCWWIESDGTSIEIAGGGENITWINPRFEARGTAAATGGTVVKLANVKSWQMLGGYCEETYVNFLTETSSNNTGVIKGMRFSGAEADVAPAGLKANTFVSNGIVTFDSNQFNVASVATDQVIVQGINSGLLTNGCTVWSAKNDSQLSVCTKTINVTASGTAEDLFTFSRTDTNNADNQQMVSGTLVVSVAGKTSGGTKSYMSQRYPIMVDGFANTTMVCTLGAASSADDNAVGATLAAAVKAGATGTDLTIQATYSLASFGDAKMTAYVELIATKHPSYAHITISAVAA